MNYRSTRGSAAVPLDVALVRGIAPDGGLFMPEILPSFTNDDFAAAETVHEVAARYLAPYFDGSSLGADLECIVGETFSFPLPVAKLQIDDQRIGMLELFHGRTAAFKDVGAAFLAACVSRLDQSANSPLTILVATSGDTGGAVAAAFDRRSGVRVAVLYPDGRVSDRQAHQLSCWSDNVQSFAVNGSFDDCQAMVKSAMNDPDLSRFRFSSANSINVGRLLPQSIYYAHASLQHFRATGRKPSFVVPTGNLGNAFAAIMARESGLPIGDIVLATNANRTIADFLERSVWEPRASLQTLASAMDVGNPSNMERLRDLLGDADALRDQVGVRVVDDAAIRDEIVAVDREAGVAICPHTATATFTYRNMPDADKQSDWIVVATAHAAKFESIVEPLIGRTVELPPALADILDRERRYSRIDANLDSLVEQLDAQQGTSDK